MNYELIVGEPWDFEGPDGRGRILVSGLGMVYVIDNENRETESFLVQVIHPFVMEGQKVKFLVCAERHSGDIINHIASVGGTVGVWRVREGMEVQKEQKFLLRDLKYCIIGYLEVVR